MYSACTKIDDSLLWIELEGTFQTKAAARKALQERRSKVKIMIVKMSKQEKQIKATIRVRHKSSIFALVA